jgi:ASPM-SPD-2-Hydin domain-containing protein
MKRALAILVCLGCAKVGLHSLPSSGSTSTQLAFGQVLVGDHKTLPLKVTNESLTAFDLVGVDVASPFSVAASPVTIEGSTSTTVQVTFAPLSDADYDQALTLQLTATETPSLTVRLTGTGLPVTTPPPPPPGCSAATCSDGQACCNDTCVDTQSDAAHCGGCSACPSGQICITGTCVIPAPTACDDVTAPCPGGQKCCNHACTAVGPGGLCPCTGPGGATTFDAGTIIIPMDACYQRSGDLNSTPQYCNANAKTVGDDSPLKAYGLVFFLLRHGVTVYMAINPDKTAIDAVDLSLGSFVTHSAPVQRYDWASNKVVPLADTSIASVSYRGAPFIIDASEHDKVLQLLGSDADFAQFRSAASITVHVAGKSFQTGIAKSISAVPSRVALLVPANDATPTQILVRYLDSAGLNFPGAGGTPAAHGLIYDQLQEADFLPDWDHSNLKAGGYSLLWSPHWEGGTGNTQAQLGTIGAFVAAGNDLFAECAAIGTLEGFAGGFNGGGGGSPGNPATRFMTPSGMAGNTLPRNRGGYTGPFVLGGLTSPFAQRGDFPFAGFTGAITDFHPGSGNYYSDVVRYIAGTDTNGAGTDLFASVDLHAQGKGTVVYLSGHDYSYTGDNQGTPGVTAGSRLVLNTLFSLGQNNLCAP